MSITGSSSIRRSGRTDASDLTVSVNVLMPVSEPLSAVE